MRKNEAFKVQQKLNPPMYPAQPMPYAVCQIGKEYFVVHMPTKKIVNEKGEAIKSLPN